jgi:hypothetical protein
MKYRSTSWSPTPSSVARWRIGPQVGLDGAALALDGGLLHLEAGERLGFVGALGNQIAPCLALLVGQGHRRPGPPFARGSVEAADECEALEKAAKEVQRAGRAANSEAAPLDRVG